MRAEGNLNKMRADPANPVRYYLQAGSEELCMNEFIGHSVRLEYEGHIHCIRCGRETKTSFAQGYCYPCFISAPETEDCVLHPELCRAHAGESRDMDFARDHCLIDHFVYLAISSGLKVGVTRHTQIPTRWIDQGAWKAIAIARTPNRFMAGTIEVALKQKYQDKTNWRDMLLKHEPNDLDLGFEKSRALSFLHPDFRQFAIEKDEITHLHYPVSAYPSKVKAINLDKDPVLEGPLAGIKGQYLIFQGGEVLNIRKFGGYRFRMIA